MARPPSKDLRQIGGYTRVLSLWINHVLRSASDAKPRVRHRECAPDALGSVTALVSFRAPGLTCRATRAHPYGSGRAPSSSRICRVLTGETKSRAPGGIHDR